MRLLIPALCLGLAFASAAAAQEPPVRLSQLHDALHLTADQEGAWRAYEAAVAPPPGAQSRHEAAQRMLPQLTTPRRIALIDATMSQDLADFRRQGAAIDAFYGRLTPEQQAVFDRQTAPPAQSQSQPQRQAPQQPED